MRIVAYFIGGPADLSKRVLEASHAPWCQVFARLDPIEVPQLKMAADGCLILRPLRDVYRLAQVTRIDAVETAIYFHERVE